ncbi:dynein light chain Tctex-type protein 2 [Plutella xylostella]|uniref:dynein light chain Tctex-type protein 2 n=1 Tax=Plutella xylostella TaxID=51655 RepID=UPI0020326CA5|nr:dynein light chain Tctex-type protein 2 [Plutella xylostella]
MSKNFKRISLLGHRHSRPKAAITLRTYQPTYRLEPKKKFDRDVVQRIVERILAEELHEVEYTEKAEKLIPDLCLTLADTIRTAVKEENYDRYRIIVAVTIGQRRQQGVQIFHSFLWDHERDSLASSNFENPHIFANAVVYGVYLD